MRKGLLALAVLVTAARCAAQDASELNKLQFHGFAAQAVVATSHNNYLGMDSRHGSAGWTEAALNINDQVNEKLRVGLQLHYTRLGMFGGENVGVDWATGDYRASQAFGVRAGKVKIRWGLYNDTQDYDPGYMWALLPEPIYAVDWRATNMSQNGVEVYGKVQLGEANALQYSGYYGAYSYAADDGYAETFREQGLNFVSPPGGKTPGFDLRWITPLQGFTVGGSLMMYDARGNLDNGSFHQPTAYWPTYYAQYNFRKVFASWQYDKVVQYNVISVPGSDTEVDGTDTRGWFVMGGYHLTPKFQAGAYYTHYLIAGGDNSDPANYFHDWVASGRYDFNTDVYLKLEGHFIDGNGVGFYGANNPNGLMPRTNGAVAKVGFTF